MKKEHSHRRLNNDGTVGGSLYKIVTRGYYENEEPEAWKLLQQYQREITAYFDQISISLFIEPADGCAF